MPNLDDSILVVGGGIGGLATALALSRSGRRVTLFEQADAFKEIGAGIQVGPNAFQMFKALGVSDEIKDVATFPDALVVMDSLSGERLTEIQTGRAFQERFENPYGLIHRADLQAVLVAACRRSPLVTLHTGQKVISFTDHGSHVEVVLKNGGQYVGAALIGADGIWSTVRPVIVADGTPRVSGHIAYRAVLPIAEVPEANNQNTMTVWAGPKSHLVHYPIRKGKVYNLVAVFHSDRYEEGWDTFGDASELRERFMVCRPEVRDLLNKIETWRMWVLCDRDPVKDWCRGRVGLLGDAAHPMLQYLAQGAVMAIEDAVCLAKRLEGGNQDIARALRDYQSRRYLRTTRVQVTARLYGAVFHASNATRDLRNAFLRARSQSQSYDSLDWIYNPREVSEAVY